MRRRKQRIFRSLQKSKSFASCSAHKGREKGSPWQVNKGPRGKTPSERFWLTYWISLSFVGEARAYLWTSSMYECPTDLLLVFAESTMSLFVVASQWLHSAIFIKRLSTPHFAHPSNEFSLLHDDCARSASQFVANPLPPTDQLLRLPRPSPKTWNINKKPPSDRSLVLWMGTDTLGVIRDSSSMCLYRWWLFFSCDWCECSDPDLTFFPSSPPHLPFSEFPRSMSRQLFFFKSLNILSLNWTSPCSSIISVVCSRAISKKPLGSIHPPSLHNYQLDLSACPLPKPKHFCGKSWIRPNGKHHMTSKPPWLLPAPLILYLVRARNGWHIHRVATSALIEESPYPSPRCNPRHKFLLTKISVHDHKTLSLLSYFYLPPQNLREVGSLVLA